MISKEFFDAIQGAMERAISLEDDRRSERLLKRAAAALDRAYHQAQEATVAADPDPVHGQRIADEALVDHAIRRHALTMLQNMDYSKRPAPSDVFPTYQTAIAQWHLARIIALRAAPVDLAAAQLREEALAALDTTTKEPPA